MSSKSSPRTRRLKHSSRDDLNSKYETLVQVHRISKSETSSEKDNQSNLSLSRTDNSEDGESNKAFQIEDYNENVNNSTRNIHNTPSREISIDGEAQINTKILSLIETEMKKDIKRQSHFTESRPQSLSFYEDEKIPEELSGNLELLSPEERKHYRKRKDHQLDSDERKAYNAIQDLYTSRDGDELTSSSKKSKSRRKRHVDPELGIGDSREMMIPKEKKKSKKKKRESTSPMSSNTKRKHKRRDEEHELKNDVTVALEELHDDVFENTHEEHNKGRKMKDVQDGNDRLYVQKKNKFEVLSTSRPSSRAMYKDPNINDIFYEKIPRAPLNVAISIQKYCIYLFLPCHGLLAGLTFGQWLYLICNQNNENIYFLDFYSQFNDVYMGLFHLLITICLISSFDRMDIAHVNRKHFYEYFSMSYRIIGIIVITFYFAALILHMSVSSTENRLSLISMKNNVTVIDLNITPHEIKLWNQISLWRFICVFIPWLLIAGKSSVLDNMLMVHLQSMLKYLPEK